MNFNTIYNKFVKKQTDKYVGREIYTLEPLINLHDPIFLAGPSRRPNDPEFKKDGWREEAVRLLREADFNGDIIIPEPRDKQPLTDWSHRRQVDWETEGLHKAHRIIFWIPRSEDLPGYTTNIEFGEWLNSGKIYVGWPNGSLRNDYLQDRLDKKHIIRYHKLQEIVDDYMNYQNEEPRMYFTSDTHFGQERTRQFSLRPFDSLEEMDLKLYSAFNRDLRQKDILVHCGDFGEFEAMDSLNIGKILFFKGNYERKDMANYKLNFLKKYSNRIVELSEENNTIELVNPENKDDIQTIYITHEPTFGIGPKNAIFIYGHTHCRSMARINGIDVGIDFQYRPLSIKDLWFFINVIRNKYWDEEVHTNYVGKRYKQDHELIKNEIASFTPLKN